MKNFLILFLYIASIFAETQFSYVPGRSGDILIRSKEEKDNALIYLMNSKIQSESLNDQSYADLVSHLLGGPIINTQIDRASFPKSSLFDKSTANTLFVIDSLDSEALAQFDDLKMVNQNGKFLKLAKTSYPQDTIATMATLSSGVSPSVHGITASHWASYLGQISAYRAGALPFSQNLADSFSQTFEGRSLIFSSSSNFQMSSAFGVNQFVHYPFNNDVTLFWNVNTRRFESVYTNSINASSLLTSAIDHTTIMSKTPLPMPGSQDSIVLTPDAKYTINMPSKGIKVVFTATELTIFLAELQSVRNLLTTLKTESFSSMVSDSVPDLFTFSFASLKNIERKYSQSSSQYRALVYLLDESIVAAVKELETIYHKISSQIIFMGTTADQLLAEDGTARTEVYNIVGKNARKDVFYYNFPSIYLNDRENLGQICDAIEAVLSYDVFCANHEFHGDDKWSWPSYNNQTTNSTTYGKDAAVFQICLWFPIILVLALLAIVIAFCTMDVGGDSMIYRATNLRHPHSS